MSAAVRVDVRPDAVAVLTIDQPGRPVNVLTPGLWDELGAAVDGLAGRGDVRGLVVASGKPGVFIAGADLRLLAAATGPNDPAVRAFIDQGLRVLAKLEAVPFPDVRAIDGVALGGGLEVALACDYRMTGENLTYRIGLPEVALGLIPGWGGTQRLPRLVGLAAAADLVTHGRSISLDEAYAIGENAPSTQENVLLHEAVASSWLIDGAALRLDVRGEFYMSRRSRVRLPMSDAARGEFAPVTELRGAAAEAVRVMTAGAALPLADGIKLETEAFMRLAGSDESRRLIAAFFAARKR